METAPQHQDQLETVLINDVEIPFQVVARRLTRTTYIGRNSRGEVQTAEGQALARRMEENAARHARERAINDGLEMPIVFDA